MLYKDLLTKEELAALLEEPEHSQAADEQALPFEQLIARVEDLQCAVELLRKRVEHLEALVAHPKSHEESPEASRTEPPAPAPISLPSRKEKFGTRKTWFSF